MGYKVKRFLRWYDKISEALVGRIELKDVALAKLQQAFGADANNPMYDCYLVETDAQCRLLESIVDISIRQYAWDYFIEADTI
jgi:hypothetical protein